MSDREFDIVVYGATGYTGQFVAEEVARVAAKNQLSFALAGRNADKLAKSISLARTHTELTLADVPIVVADVADEESLVSMAKRARVVINCVGPYRFYGEQVVRACIEGGADHVDISGEPQYLESVQLKLHTRAKEEGVHVVGACGFDSVPADMGTLFLQENFGGDVNSVEMVVGMHDSSVGNAPINFTTMECAVHGLAHSGELRSIRRQLYPERLPSAQYKPQKRGNLWYSEAAGRWCVPNMASDRSVVNRTQRHHYDTRQRRPAQFEAFFGMSSKMWGVASILWGVFFYFMASFGLTRKLLLKYPEVFSFGAFTRTGPNRDDLKGMKFCVTLTGQGWDTTLDDPMAQHDDPPKVTRTARVVGPDPGYFGTAAIVVRCALTVLQEKAKLPERGGVYSPGAAFLDTSLIARLTDAGISFTME